jgi:hypothetical protein
MENGCLLPGIIVPIAGLLDPELSACHPLAPVVSIAIRTMAALDYQQIIPPQKFTPAIVLQSMGTMGSFLEIKLEEVTEALKKMTEAGIVQVGINGHAWMRDQKDLTEDYHFAVIDYDLTERISGGKNA